MGFVAYEALVAYRWFGPLRVVLKEPLAEDLKGFALTCLAKLSLK